MCRIDQKRYCKCCRNTLLFNELFRKEHGGSIHLPLPYKCECSYRTKRNNQYVTGFCAQKSRRRVSVVFIWRMFNYCSFEMSHKIQVHCIYSPSLNSHSMCVSSSSIRVISCTYLVKVRWHMLAVARATLSFV